MECHDDPVTALSGATSSSLWYRARCALLSSSLFIAAYGCGGEPTGPTLAAGQVTYTITTDGASGSQQWSGSALLRSPQQQFWIEFNTTTSAVDGPALWYFANAGLPATLLGAHPVRARGVGTGDTVWVWWGHIVSDDPRTTGSLHLTRADSLRVDGTFSYHAPAGTGAAQHFVTIEGQFSAVTCAVLHGGPCPP